MPLDISYAECVVGPELPLITAVENALSAPLAIALLSPASVPTVWKRAEWERVFIEAPQEFDSQLGIVLLHACAFPAVLRREKFFDLATNYLEGARRLKQWLLRPDEAPRAVSGHPELRAALADRPGALADIPSADAAAFLLDCAVEFDQVCHVNAAGRTDAGLLADIGHALGITLPESATRNRELLSEYFQENRVLLVCDGLTPDRANLVAFPGLASVITTTGQSLAPPLPDEIAAVSQLPGLLQSDFPNGLRLGWKICDFLSVHQRHAEKIEILEHMEAAAKQRADAMALYRIVHELAWLRDGSTPDDVIRVLPTASTEVRQLDLFA